MIAEILIKIRENVVVTMPDYNRTRKASTDAQFMLEGCAATYENICNSI